MSEQEKAPIIENEADTESSEQTNKPINDLFSVFSDLSDIPPELMKELNLDDEYQIDRKILTLFEKAGGTLNISELLIGFYRVHNEIKTRQYINGKLYRLTKKGLLESTGKKGGYKLTNI